MTPSATEDLRAAMQQHEAVDDDYVEYVAWLIEEWLAGTAHREDIQAAGLPVESLSYATAAVALKRVLDPYVAWGGVRLDDQVVLVDWRQRTVTITTLYDAYEYSKRYGWVWLDDILEANNLPPEAELTKLLARFSSEEYGPSHLTWTIFNTISWPTGASPHLDLAHGGVWLTRSWSPMSTRTERDPGTILQHEPPTISADALAYSVRVDRDLQPQATGEITRLLELWQKLKRAGERVRYQETP